MPGSTASPKVADKRKRPFSLKNNNNDFEKPTFQDGSHLNTFQ